MKRHHITMAASVDEHSDGAVAAVADQPQQAMQSKARWTEPVLTRAGFPPAGVTAREHTLILVGELDSGSAHELEAEIERLCEERVTSITLDLRQLTYIDQVGVAVIAFRCRLCQRRGYEFALIPGGRRIHRAFEQAGVARLLPFLEEEVAPAPLQTAARARAEREGVAPARLEKKDAPAPTLAPADPQPRRSERGRPVRGRRAPAAGHRA
jgi:anti-anti-sigma factor